MGNISDFQNYEDLSKTELLKIIKEQHEKIKNLTYVTYTDLLTTNYLKTKGIAIQIFNRTYWEEVFKVENANIECDFYLLDTNNLKNINDSFGHLVGDDLICKCAEIACKFGIVVRLGGDEFALIVTNGKEKECANYFEQNIKTLPFAYGLFKKTKNTSFLDTIKMADYEMYKTKCKMKSTKK